MAKAKKTGNAINKRIKARDKVIGERTRHALQRRADKAIGSFIVNGAVSEVVRRGWWWVAPLLGPRQSLAEEWEITQGRPGSFAKIADVDDGDAHRHDDHAAQK